MVQKPIITIYSEFTADRETWTNRPAPPLDESLVKELEAIATLTDYRPRYRVRWGMDCFLDVPDELDISDSGIVVGVEKGGRFHDDPVCMFDRQSGYRFKDERGFECITDDLEKVPTGAIPEVLMDTVSIGKPRFRLEEFLDRRTSEIFGDGDYFTVWTLEERILVRETPKAIEIESVYRPLLRYDVEQATSLYNERLNDTPHKIKEAYLREVEAKTKQRIEKAEREKAEQAEMTEKFFADKAYRPKEKGVKIYV